MDQPAYLNPFVVDVAKTDSERIDIVDVYRPAQPTSSPPQLWPVVVVIHGGPLPADTTPRPRDWPVYRGYGSLIATAGLIAVVVEHRLHDLASFASAADDVAAAIRSARDLPGADPNRVALWFFSGGGLLSADYLTAPAPPWLRAVALTYPVLAPFSGAQIDSRFHPVAVVANQPSGQAQLDLRRQGLDPARVLLTRVGLERPEIAASVIAFERAARSASLALTVIDVPDGHHGFDYVDHDGTSREAVLAAVRWVSAVLAGEG